MDEQGMEDLTNALCGKASDEHVAVLFGDFYTIREALQLVEALRGEANNASAIREVVTKVCANEGGASGCVQDYRALIDDFLAVHDFQSARDIAVKALSFFPCSIDLLADAVRAAFLCGDFDECARLERAARSIGIAYWNGGLFESLVDARVARLDTCRPDMRADILRDAHALADEWIEQGASGGRAYAAKASLFCIAGDSNRARALLSRVVLGKSEVYGSTIADAACCVAYLKLIEPQDKESCERIVHVARRGILGARSTDSAVDLGYLMLREAQALDILAAIDPVARDLSTHVAGYIAGRYACARDLLKDDCPELARIAQGRRLATGWRDAGDVR